MKPDLTNTMVLAWNHDEPIFYAGLDPDRNGMESLLIGFGRQTELRCDPNRVAPQHTPLADAKDPRIHVEKRSLTEARACGHYGRGSWLLTLPDFPRGMWHNTKGEAVRAGQRRLAILDWHASMAHLSEPPVEEAFTDVTDLKRRLDAVRQAIPAAAALGQASRAMKGVELNGEVQQIKRLLADRDPGDPKTADLRVALTAVRVQVLDEVLGMSV